MPTPTWFTAPLPTRAPRGGCIDPLNGRTYRGGEDLPFYVPRPVMPQLDEAAYPGFLALCADKGIAVTRETVDPATLRNHQRIDTIHAAQMPEAVRAKPILVSADGFILDGNHRWALHRKLGLPVACLRVALPFEQAVALLFSDPDTYDLADKPQGN